MKISTLGVLVVLLGGLAVQGCSATGATKPDPAASAAGTAATATADEATVNPATKADFVKIAAEVRKGLLPGGTWGAATESERKEIDVRLDNMQALFDQFGSVANMDEKSKLQLFNDQEYVNHVLAQEADQRIVCEQTTITGTLLPIRRCRTYAEMKREHATTKTQLEKFRHTNADHNLSNINSTGSN